MAGTSMSPTRKGISLFGWTIKHWYIVGFLILILPSIIGAVVESVKTDNPYYPFTALGVRILNADAFIFDITKDMKEDFTKVIKYQKQEKFNGKSLVYSWFFIKNIIYPIAFALWALMLPFILLKRIVHFTYSGETSPPIMTFIITFIVFTIYLVVMNLIIAIHGLVAGNALITFTEGMSYFEELKVIINYCIPYKGVGSLMSYIFSLVVN